MSAEYLIDNFNYFNAQRPTSNIQHPRKDSPTWALDVGRWMLDVHSDAQAPKIPAEAGTTNTVSPHSESFVVPPSGGNAGFRRGLGFTLIELLFVVLLLGTVMTVIMASFEGGFRVYDRVSAFGTGEMEAYLAGETIARDLKNAIQTGETPFSGEAGAMEMLTVAAVGEAAGQLLQVRYQVGESGVQRLAMLPAGTAASAIEAEGIDRLLGRGFVLKLRYQGAASGGGAAGGWSDTWAGSSNLPVAVQFEIAGDALIEGPVVRTVLLETASTEEAP